MAASAAADPDELPRTVVAASVSELTSTQAVFAVLRRFRMLFVVSYQSIPATVGDGAAVPDEDDWIALRAVLTAAR